MMSILLILAGQSLSEPPRAPAAPPKTSPVIYALVFVEKPPAWEPVSRKVQMKYEAAYCRYEREVLETVLRADKVSRLKVVREQKDAQNPKNARKWLEKTIRVESVEDTGVLRISFAAGSPKEQVAIVNAIAKAYVQVANENRRTNYEELIADRSKEGDQAEKAVEDIVLRIEKLDGVKAKNKDQAARIANERKNWERLISRMEEQIKVCVADIRRRQAVLRKPHSTLLELAELPPESK